MEQSCTADFMRGFLWKHGLWLGFGEGRSPLQQRYESVFTQRPHSGLPSAFAAHWTQLQVFSLSAGPFELFQYSLSVRKTVSENLLFARISLKNIVFPSVDGFANAPTS